MSSRLTKSVKSVPATSPAPESAEQLGAGPQDPREVYSLSLTKIKQHADYADYQFKPAPFTLRWIHGYNPKVGVINLNKVDITNVFYAACNCGVVWNWKLNTMSILQGHRHMVTCIAADEQGRWLVTGDTGPENVVIIWDSQDLYPQRTIFSPQQSVKLEKLAISRDAKYLLTLGYADKATLNWWIWSYGWDRPHASVEIEILKDSVIEIEFNPVNSTQFALLTKLDIWIGASGKIKAMERGVMKETNDYEIKVICPLKRVDPAFGKLSCFTFVKGTCQILVGTTKGGLVVYGYTIEYRTDIDPNITSNIENLKFVKVLKIEEHRINVIKNIDGVVVTGNSNGEIHFYDEQMKLLYWAQTFSVDCVKGLSFDISPRSCMILDPKFDPGVDPETGLQRKKLIKKKIQTDATLAEKTFLVRDFIVVTQNDGIGFVDFAKEKFVTILDYRTAHAVSLSAHPEKSVVCIGYADGTIELVDYQDHKVCHRVDLRDVYKTVIPPDDDDVSEESSIIYPSLSVFCLNYSPSGTHLACGLNTGQLLFLHPATIDVLTKPPFKDTSHAIKEINYSPDSMTLVFSDDGNTVGVYKYDCDTAKWSFIGKHRAHYKDVSTAFFLPQKNPDGEYKLISLGQDRIMVEYDIGNSSPSEERLEILSMDRIEQAAVPLCGIPWPTPTDISSKTEGYHTDLPLILMANDEFKYKILNHGTAMTLATYLGPRYEHPVERMLLTSRRLLDKQGQEQLLEYLVFASRNVIGLQRMPLDGNPWKHTGMLGHPNQILKISYRHDLSTMFTIGSKDSCVCQWSANHSAPDQSLEMGGIDLDPYYCLVESGRPGWLFQEVRDLFYYIQILCQGTFSPAMRRVSDLIPIDSLPDLVRALGFFPSEYEVENLLVEAKYQVYRQSPAAELDFEQFVRLYLNHRPAFTEPCDRLRRAFATFATEDQPELAMERDELVNVLGSYGERFPGELSWYLLSILAGQSFEERANTQPDDFSFLPERITFSELSRSLLGLQEPASSPLLERAASDSCADSERQEPD